MIDKSSMKITYCNKHNDSSTQPENSIVSIRFIKHARNEV